MGSRVKLLVCLRVARFPCVIIIFLAWAFKLCAGAVVVVDVAAAPFAGAARGGRRRQFKWPSQWWSPLPLRC